MRLQAILLSTCLAPAFALAQIPVVGEDACPKFAVDVASSATCVGDRVAPLSPEPGLKIAAIPPQEVPARKRTDSDLYVSAAEADRILQAYPGQAVLIDIRSRVEAAYVGQPDAVDIHVPYMEPLLPLQWNSASGSLAMQRNPAFVAKVKAEMARLGRPEDSTILLLCRSGERSAIAADALAAAGLARVFTIVDGFEGEIGASGRRDFNGWKNTSGRWQAKPQARLIFAARP